MAQRTDFQQEAPNGDLNILNGDLTTAPSNEQHISDIIISFPGWWKEFTQLGVGVYQYFNSDGQNQAIISSMVQQLQSDGYTSQPSAIYQPDGTYLIHPNATLPLG